MSAFLLSAEVTTANASSAPVAGDSREVLLAKLLNALNAIQTSEGGNSGADAGKLAKFDENGGITAATLYATYGMACAYHSIGTGTISANSLTTARAYELPNAGGTFALQEWVTATYGSPSVVGKNLLTLTNPSAVTFLKIGADNTVSARTAAQMVTDLNFGYGRVTSDWTSSSTTFTDVTGLSFAVEANGNYTAELVLYCIGGSSGQGLKFKVTGPASPTSVLIAILGNTSSNSSFQTEIQTSFSATPASQAYCAGSSVTGMVRIRITVINGANAGTVQLQADNGTGSGTVTIKVNSSIDWRKTN